MYLCQHIYENPDGIKDISFRGENMELIFCVTSTNAVTAYNPTLNKCRNCQV